MGRCCLCTYRYDQGLLLGRVVYIYTVDVVFDVWAAHATDKHVGVEFVLIFRVTLVHSIGPLYSKTKEARRGKATSYLP